MIYRKMILYSLLAIVFSSQGFAKQVVPDAKRQKEIRAALIAHGYESGRTWLDTVQILKKIAREHHWQSKHAPDARTLILLGLGNKYSDPSILDEPPTRLESWFVH